MRRRAWCAAVAAAAVGVVLLTSACSTSFAFGLGDPGGRVLAVGAENEYALHDAITNHKDTEHL